MKDSRSRDNRGLLAEEILRFAQNDDFGIGSHENSCTLTAKQVARRETRKSGGEPPHSESLSATEANLSSRRDARERTSRLTSLTAL